MPGISMAVTVLVLETSLAGSTGCTGFPTVNKSKFVCGGDIPHSGEGQVLRLLDEASAVEARQVAGLTVPAGFLLVRPIPEPTASDGDPAIHRQVLTILAFSACPRATEANDRTRRCLQPVAVDCTAALSAGLCCCTAVVENGIDVALVGFAACDALVAGLRRISRRMAYTVPAPYFFIAQKLMRFTLDFCVWMLRAVVGAVLTLENVSVRKCFVIACPYLGHFPAFGIQ